MRSRLREMIASLLIIGIAPLYAMAVDEMISAPTLGTDYDASHTATKAKITEVEGTLREDFPEGGFVIPTGASIELKASRASGDWDTHLWGDPCDVETSPVSDTLRPETRPRWKCNIGNFPNGDTGTAVIWQAPEAPGLLPGVQMQLFEDDEISYDGSDDGGHESEYGVLQDSVMVRAFQFVELDVISSLPVSHHTDPPGANAYDILGLWHFWEGECGGYRIANTYDDSLNPPQYIDTDQNGTSLLYGSHPHATGTRLKVELTATAWKHAQLPADILLAMEEPTNWKMVQLWRYGLCRNGTPFPVDDSDMYYTADWTSDGYSVGGGTYWHSLRVDMDRHFLKGWLYYADAPGCGNFPPSFQYLCEVGDVLEDKPQFKTKVCFKYRDTWHDVTYPLYTLWGTHERMTWTQTDPDIWEITTPAHREY